MPYKIRKSGSGYKVTSPGRSYSKKPMSKEKASKQLAAIKMHTNESTPPMTSVFGPEQPPEDQQPHDKWWPFRDEDDFMAGPGPEFDEWVRQQNLKYDKPPKMESVFRVHEAPIQNRPPPGSQPVKDTEYATMGAKGQALKTGLDAMKKAGQEQNVFKTPAGDITAFPKDAAPGRGPVKADITKGVWSPVTGSSATGTPFASQAPTTTMK